jgi:hypothetical protein
MNHGMVITSCFAEIMLRYLISLRVLSIVDYIVSYIGKRRNNVSTCNLVCTTYPLSENVIIVSDMPAFGLIDTGRVGLQISLEMWMGVIVHISALVKFWQEIRGLVRAS